MTGGEACGLSTINPHRLCVIDCNRISWLTPSRIRSHGHKAGVEASILETAGAGETGLCHSVKNTSSDTKKYFIHAVTLTNGSWAI